MDLRQLRYFVGIVEQGSITRAAARLDVAQPALSLHLGKMETHLGTQLLTRCRSGGAYRGGHIAGTPGAGDP